MKTIALIMLSALAIDLIFAAFFFPSWQAAIAGTVVALFAMVLIRRGRAKNAGKTNSAWLLGEAVELSDPNHPRSVQAAVLTPDILNLGLLAIGSPGAGKTDSVMLGYIRALPQHSPRSGWAFFDGKGDIDTYQKCVAMGCPPDHFFSSELPGSESINLFQGAPFDVIDRLSKILIGSTATTSFYMDEQRAVLARIVPLLLQLPVATNLRDLYVALCMKGAGNELIRRAQDAGVDSVEIMLARQWLEQPFAARLKNIAGLLNCLFIFVSGPYADRLNAYQPDISISNIVPRGESVYFHLPLTNFARDVAISIIETFAVETRNRQLYPAEDLTGYPLLFDDWGAFFHDGFGPFSARCRSAAMPLSFGFQSHAQLRAVSHTYADELDDTIATKIIMRVQGESTAQYAARLLGKFDFLDVGAHYSTGRSESSLRYMRRDRIDGRALRQLQRGEAYISTLLQNGERISNPLWRLRFTLPEFGTWSAVPLPETRLHAEGEGLGFWGRYMDPTALSDIHRSVERAKRVADTSANARNEQSRADAQAAISANPGLRVDS